MQNQTGRVEYYEAWAKMMVTIWEEKIIQKNIHDTGELLKSFQYSVEANANGDVTKIVHTFLYYGRMVDMGVRRGVHHGDPDVSRKPWYNKTYYHSLKVLSEKAAALYGEEFQFTIHETLTF